MAAEKCNVKVYFLLNDWLFEPPDQADWCYLLCRAVGGLNTGQAAPCDGIKDTVMETFISALFIWSLSCVQPRGIVAVDKWVGNVGRKKARGQKKSKTGSYVWREKMKSWSLKSSLFKYDTAVEWDWVVGLICSLVIVPMYCRDSH